MAEIDTQLKAATKRKRKHGRPTKEEIKQDKAVPNGAETPSNSAAVSARLNKPNGKIHKKRKTSHDSTSDESELEKASEAQIHTEPETEASTSRDLEGGDNDTTDIVNGSLPSTNTTDLP